MVTKKYYSKISCHLKSNKGIFNLNSISALKFRTKWLVGIPDIPLTKSLKIQHLFIAINHQNLQNLQVLLIVGTSHAF